MRLLTACAVLAAPTALAACGSDSSASPSPSPSSSSSPSPSPSSSSSPASADQSKGIATIAPPASSSTARGPQQCARQGDITVKIVLGDIDCATAYGVAARVDRDGDKRQTIGGYVCEFGNASIRPTIFSCTDNTNGAEFSVDET